MKKLRKVLALVLAMVMVLAMGITASAATTGSITINNAAIGETYYIYKVLGATTNSTGGIDYTGEIPNDLKAYLAPTTVTKNGVTYNVIGKKDGVNDETLFAALKTWAVGNGDTPDYNHRTPTSSQTASSNVVTFNVDAGYYVIVSTQGNVVMVDSATNPTATVYEKNTTTPVIDKEKGKVVDDAEVKIGDTVTYTVTFTTANYAGAGADAKQITMYTINDTLPDFLSNVKITSLTIGGTEKVYTEAELAEATTAFTTNKQIDIDWVDGTTSLYSNGAQVVITYTATVTDKVAVAGEAAASKNEVTLSYTTSDSNTTEVGKSESEISTYAAQINKVDASGNALPGATFSIAGLQLTGNPGNYTVTGATAADGTDTVMSCDADGKLVIRGLDNINYQVTEVTAPSGFNKLEGTFTLNPVVESTTVTVETYTIANGVKTTTGTENKTIGGEGGDTFANVLNAAAVPVINQAGAELPSTGGMGTTIFYVVGAILVIGAGIVLVTRRRMAK